MPTRTPYLRSAFRPYGTTAGRAVAHRRRVIVSLLQQAPHGLTAREIREATGFSKTHTASALTGLFVHHIVEKHRSWYVLTAMGEAEGPTPPTRASQGS
jgi:predicted transcriptional regulator